MTRPENEALPADMFYSEAKKYAFSSRMNVIQTDIASRCLDFLQLDRQSLILDLGCGTGISGRELGRNGHYWIGCDISRDMLLMSISNSNVVDDEATDGNNMFPLLNEYDSQKNKEENECSNVLAEENGKKEYLKEQEMLNYQIDCIALFHLDISKNIPFKTGVFDAFVSVSCFQWLFHNRNIPESRSIVRKLFMRIRDVLKYKGKGVIQFYSLHNDHTQILIDESRKAGFFSELVTDGEGRNLKEYLLLDCNIKEKTKKKHKVVDKVREKIAKMKERRINRGLSVSKDSKYSGRKRCKKFR